MKHNIRRIRVVGIICGYIFYVCYLNYVKYKNTHKFYLCYVILCIYNQIML